MTCALSQTIYQTFMNAVHGHCKRTDCVPSNTQLPKGSCQRFFTFGVVVPAKGRSQGLRLWLQTASESALFHIQRS